MKVCTKCNANYTDDTLSFCLEDGTPLVIALETDMPTAILTDTELLTSVRTEQSASDPRFMDSQVTRVSSITAETPPRSNTARTVILTAVGMIVLFAVIGSVVYLALLTSGGTANNNAEPNKNTDARTYDANSSPTPTPLASPSATIPTTNISTPTVNPTPPPADLPAIKNEVMKEIYGSKSARDSRDLSSYMSYYADTLDQYYTKRGVSRATVRADKARHFANYTSMQSDYSNMNVTVSPDGQTATAVFDKEWNFSGAKASSGKVQSELKYKWINKRWLITSERDLKVYYTR